MDKKSLIKFIISIIISEFVVGAIAWNVYFLVKINKQVGINNNNISMIINYLNSQIKQPTK